MQNITHTHKNYKIYGLVFLKLSKRLSHTSSKEINYVVDNLGLYAKLNPGITSISSVELHYKCIRQIVMILLQE